MEQTLGNNNNITDIKFTPVKIGKFNCNINRPDHEIIQLNDFYDVFPYWSKEHGLNLQIFSKKAGKHLTVPLANTVAWKLLINNASDMTEEEYYNTFVTRKKEFLAEYLIKNTFAKGYEIPSAVQEITVIELIKGNDAMVQFKAGTGKTHAFLFGTLWGFDPTDSALQYVFITSSHEVATQIYNQCKELIGTIQSVRIALCIGQKQTGNTSNTGGFKTPISTSSLMNRQRSAKDELDEICKAQVLVCTMGKFHNLYCDKKKIDTRYLKVLCVDEFDNIVASNNRSSNRNRQSSIMSTEDQMAAIIRKIPENTQRIFFSATVTQEALEIAHSYFRPPEISDPLIILLNIEDSTLEDIKQHYVECQNFMEKKDVLIDLIKQCRIAQAIIFANNIKTAIEIKYLLDQQEVPIDSAVFHGNLLEVDRTRIIKSFRDGAVRMLISTDVTSRGLDVQGVNVVFNFDMPERLETYVHRVGRSGRYNRKGCAISLILPNELQKVNEINECSISKMTVLPNDLANLL